MNSNIIKLVKGFGLKAGDVLKVSVNHRILEMMVYKVTPDKFSARTVDNSDDLTWWSFSMLLVDSRNYPVKIWGVIVDADVYPFKGYLPVDKDKIGSKPAHFIKHDMNSVSGFLDRNSKVFTSTGIYDLSEFKYFKHIN